MADSVEKLANAIESGILLDKEMYEVYLKNLAMLRDRMSRERREQMRSVLGLD